MKLKAITFLPFIFLINSFNLYSQITITEFEKSEEKIVLKPEPYDSLKNWESKERLGDYKQYIGLQIYLPPFDDPEIGSDNDCEPFMYNLEPNLIDIDSTNNKLKLTKSWHQTSERKSDWKSIEFNQIYSIVYKPYHYGSYSASGSYSELSVNISNSSIDVSNRYYTIIDVLYGSELNDLLGRLDSTLNVKESEIETILYQFYESLFSDFDSQIWENNPQKIFIHNNKKLLDFDKPEIMYLLKDEKTGDSILCSNVQRFILVPYFVKQKNLFLNKKMIYDDAKTSRGDFINSTREENDPRFVIKYEDDYGNEKSKGKQVLIEPGNKWTCTDVTLLKPSYNIYYILINDKDELVSVTNLNGFIEESIYNKREFDKKLQYQELLARQKQEKLQREENERKEIENRKAECIRLFGQQYGVLIAQGKVKINMTKDMCKYAWGVPLWSSKTTTEYITFEDWYYWLGYSLHFENGLLKRIEE